MVGKEILSLPANLSPPADQGCESPKKYWQPHSDSEGNQPFKKRERERDKESDTVKSREATWKELVFGAFFEPLYEATAKPSLTLDFSITKAVLSSVVELGFVPLRCKCTLSGTTHLCVCNHMDHFIFLIEIHYILKIMNFFPFTVIQR